MSCLQSSKSKTILPDLFTFILRPKDNEKIREELEKAVHIIWNCRLPSPRVSNKVIQSFLWFRLFYHKVGLFIFVSHPITYYNDMKVCGT